MRKRKGAVPRFVLDPTGRPVEAGVSHQEQRAAVGYARENMAPGGKRRKVVRQVRKTFRKARRGILSTAPADPTLGQGPPPIDPSTGQPITVNFFNEQGAPPTSGMMPAQSLGVRDRSKIDLADNVGNL